jgi:ribosomal protein L40E
MIIEEDVFMVSSEEISRRLEAKKRGKTYSEVKKVPQSPSNVVCSECQTENPATAKFCVGCGAPLIKEETPQEMPSETPSSTMEAPSEPDYKICPSCNQKNKPDAKFCIICGHKFATENGEKPMESLVDVVSEEETVVTEAPEAETQVSETVEVPEPETPVNEIAEVPEPETPTVEAVEAPESEIPEIKVPKHYQKEETPSEEVTAQAVPAKKTSLKETVSADEKLSSEPAEDPVVKIKKAKELLDIGAITQEEFDRIKNKYLELI